MDYRKGMSALGALSLLMALLMGPGGYLFMQMGDKVPFLGLAGKFMIGLAVAHFILGFAGLLRVKATNYLIPVVFVLGAPTLLVGPTGGMAPMIGMCVIGVAVGLGISNHYKLKATEKATELPEARPARYEIEELPATDTEEGEPN